MTDNPEQKQPPRLLAVAYYRQSNTNRLKDSLAFQQHEVREWAIDHGLEILQEFIDAGKSAQDVNQRPAFRDLMENWVQQRDDFQYVLCMDVRRWGRFQDMDLSAQFSAECQKHGKTVIYTSIGMPKEDDLSPVYRQFLRHLEARRKMGLSDDVFPS